MPLNLSIGLPGPFTYTRRLGRTDGKHGPTWWVLIGWWAVPLKYMLVLTIWVLVATALVLWHVGVQVTTALVRAGGARIVSPLVLLIDHARSPHRTGQGPDT